MSRHALPEWMLAHRISAVERGVSDDVFTQWGETLAHKLFFGLPLTSHAACEPGQSLPSTHGR